MQLYVKYALPILAMLPLGAFAQSRPITGIVLDPTGAGVGGAHLTFVSAGRSGGSTINLADRREVLNSTRARHVQNFCCCRRIPQ